VSRWLERRLAHWLSQPVRRYERTCWNDLDALRRHIRKGDVLLCEGDLRISAIIRYLTQSPWSHATLYVGDELLLLGGETAEAARVQFGDQAGELLIDALPEGVIATPLAHYADYNIRLCRPHLELDDLKHVVDGGIAALGWHYDVRNLVDLARYYLPAELVPARLRPQRTRLGSGARAAVICTSLIGSLFDRVGYPIQPIVAPPPPVAPEPATSLWMRWWRSARSRHRGVFHRRHPTLLAPCDFDRSPYFDIVKFNALRDADFDYRAIQWADADQECEP
jgi:hypothetical protein